MSNQEYPEWWNETITIYNKHENKVTHLVTWTRHVIEGCFWKNIGNKVVINNNVIETDNIICRIRKSDDYIPKHEWLELDDKASKFTLSRGDIIVYGEVTDEIIEYGASKLKATDLIDKYKDSLGCMVIKEVTINIGGGRCLEHYHIKGE